MHYEPLRIDFEAAMTAYFRERNLKRSAGRHLSEVLHYIIKNTDPRRLGKDVNLAMFLRGFMWEEVLSGVFGPMLGKWKQLEVDRDGIFMTMDGFNTERWRVKESKSTKKSARHPITSNMFWPWHMQVMGYADYFDTDECELAVLYINGAYELGGGRFGPETAKAYLLQFSKRERRENWESILRARDRMDKEEKGKRK